MSTLGEIVNESKKRLAEIKVLDSRIAAADRELTRLRAREARLMGALKFYAEQDRYDYDETCWWGTCLTKKRKAELSESGGGILADNGECARKALAALDKPMEN